MSLYDYTDSEETDTEAPPAPSLLLCLWDYVFDWHIEHLIHLSTHMRMIFMFIVKSIVCSINIDNDALSKVNPPIIKLVDISEKSASSYPGPYLGCSWGISLHEEDHGTELLQCPPKHCMEVSYSSKFFSFKNPISSEYILLDEQTGCIVLPRFASQRQSLVIDLALSHKKVPLWCCMDYYILLTLLPLDLPITCPDMF